MSQFNQQYDTPNNVQSAAFADCIANSKQIFKLINSILPLESCLRHQILPLELQGDRLTVGMLEPDDLTALNYICPIATSYGYHLDFKLIDSQTHQLMLSAYLKEPRPAPVGDRNQNIIDIEPNSQTRDRQKTVIDIEPNSQINNRHPGLDSAATLISKPEENFARNPADKSMTLTEMPEDFDFALNLAAQTKKELEHQTADKSMTLTEIPKDFISKKQSVDFHERPTIIVKDAPELSAQGASIISGEPQISNLIPETNKIKPQNYQFDNHRVLDITAEPVIESRDFLATLSPQLSCRELLTKVLDNNIDLLQLVTYSDRGSIVCSQDGLVKSSLDRVALPIFNILINEIKTLAQIPHTTLTKTKKVAMERFHQQERVLFRLEFSPHRHGEEVSIQILRGDLLMAYEQKQMDKMGEQALALAEKLEKTLKKMQLCFTSARLNNIRDLQMVQQQINRYLQLLDK